MHFRRNRSSSSSRQPAISLPVVSSRFQGGSLLITKVCFEFTDVISWLTLVELVELGLVIGKGGRDISEANAEEHVAGYGVCTDLCRPHPTQASAFVSSGH